MGPSNVREESANWIFIFFLKERAQELRRPAQKITFLQMNFLTCAFQSGAGLVWGPKILKLLNRNPTLLTTRGQQN